MNEEQKVSALLHELPVPPSQVTVSEAVRSGRRSLLRRRAATAGAAALVLVATVGVMGLVDGRVVVVTATSSPMPSVSPSPSPSPKPKSIWKASKLTVPAGTKHIQVSGIDPTGRYVVGINENAALLWDNGSPIVLPPPPANVHDITARSVNAGGVVVGNAEDTRSNVETNYPWVYQNGKTTLLAKLSGDVRVQAIKINAGGDILGWSQESGPVMWNASEPGKVRRAPGLDGGSGLGDDGTIGGRIGDGDHPGIIDPTGKAHVLAEVPGNPGGKVFTICGDWAAGWVPLAGSSTNLMAARWNLRTGELKTYPELSGAVDEVSATGAILSRRGDRPGTPVFVSPTGQVVDLPPLDERDSAAAIQLYPVGLTADATVIVGYQQGSWQGSETSAAIIWRRNS